MTIANIAKACSGTYYGSPDFLDKEISSVIIDSRQAQEGSLFAAIVGERSDGHDYISSAQEKGALCCLCERKPEDPELRVIVVESTTDALRAIAIFYRSQFDIPVVGVTGSVGKTTAKEMIASVLSQRFNTLKTQGNFNNELGVPLTLFRLREEHQVAVVEMGISNFGEMSRLTQMARPNMAVFTVIGDSHLEFLHDRQGVLKAKSEILEGMPEDGVVFVNGDDKLLRALDCSQRKLSFGTGDNCDIRGENIRNLGISGMGCDLVFGERRIPVEIPGFGLHMVSAASMGAAVGIYMGLSDEEITSGIASYEAVGSRSAVSNSGNITIIDDCYNANPNSMASAIKSLATMAQPFVCILGDMLELGENSSKLHYEIGTLAAEKGASAVLCSGPQSENICKGAANSGANCHARHYATKAELINDIPNVIKSGDAVLVKASRGMAFEEITKALKELVF